MNEKLLLGILMETVLICTTRGVLFTPDGYTLMGVEAVNGSSMNASCPVTYYCVVESTIRTCTCPTDVITGALIDGVIPTIIDTTQRDSLNNSAWASQLYTARRTSEENVTINFRFENRFTLREVELYMFNCPVMGIGAQSIHVIDGGLTFPGVLRSFAVELGSTILTGDMQSCTSLTRVSIPIQNPQNVRNYAIDFTTTLEWVHIGEVRFSDQLITTTAAQTTAAPTTMITTTVPETTETPTTEAPTTAAPTTMVTTTTVPETMEASTTAATTEVPETMTMIPTTMFQTIITSDSTTPQPDIEILTTVLTTSYPPPPTTELLISEPPTGHPEVTTTNSEVTIAPTSTQPIIFSVVIAVLLLVIVFGGIGFLVVIVWIRKAKIRGSIAITHDGTIEMKTNEAYGPVGGVRNMEEDSQEPEYELIA